MDAPAPLTHHPYGPSRWPALAACPAFTPTQGGTDAEYGTRIHGFLAGLLSGWRNGGNLDDAEATLANSHERGAWLAAKTITSLVESCAYERGALLIEHQCAFREAAAERLGLRHLAGVFGTADAAVVHAWQKGVVSVFDFKTFYDPDRDYSLQLLGYGAAIALANGLCGATIACFTVYGDRPDKNAARSFSWQEAVAELMRADYAIAQRLQADSEGRRLQPASTTTPWCKNCAHFATCENSLAAAEASQVAEVKELPASFSALSPSRAARLLALAEHVAKWADAVKAAAKQAALDGITIADDASGLHYALKTRAGRKVIRVLDLWAAASAHGVTKGEYLSAVTLSSTAATELLRAHGLTAKEAKELIAANADTTAGTLTLERA